MKQAERACGRHELVPPDYFRRLTLPELGSGDRPLEIDVGSGDGGFLLALAATHPDRAFLGIERLLGRARKICRKAAAARLENLRVLRLETGYALEYLLPPHCARRVHLLFPDPWPKYRHRERRFLRAPMIPVLHRVLEPGGELCFKSDDEPYFEEGRRAVLDSGLFAEVAWYDSGRFYPSTDFERQWTSEGRRIHRARFVRHD